MADEQQPIKKKEEGRGGTWGASIPAAGGWENLPLPERIRGTFDRGVTRAEIDLADAYQKGIMPGHIPDVQKRIGRQIGAEFGGKFSVHAPYQIEFSSPSSFQQAEAAEILKQTVKYAKDMQAKLITIHPTTVMGSGFQDPFTGALQAVPGYMLCKNKKEFDDYCRIHNIREGTTIYTQVEQYWNMFFYSQSAVMTQQHAAAAPIFARDFGAQGAEYDSIKAVAELDARGITDKTTMMANVEAVLTRYMSNRQVPGVADGAMQVYNNFKSDPERFLNELVGTIRSWKSKGGDPVKISTDAKRHYWAEATLCVGGQLNEDGTYASPVRKEDGMAEKEINFREALAGNRVIDLPNEEHRIIDNLKSTLEMAFKDEELVKLLKENKITLSFENLYGMNPETGWMNGFAYYTRPEHIVAAVRAAREVARAHGIPEDRIGTTFDTEHAAIGYGDPSKFIDELQRQGIKITHAHVVGGSASGSAPIFGHKGLGSMEDEILRKHPDLLKKLVESGVPMTLEPGMGGIKDIEQGLETMMTGTPTEAMLAANYAPEQVRQLGYTGEPSYYAAAYQLYQGFANKAGFYSFGPHVQEPFRTTFGPVASPTLYSGGIAHRDQPSLIWPSQQPISYRSRQPVDED